MAVTTGEGQKDANLAVFDPPGRAWILSPCSDRMRPLLQVPCLIHDKRAVPIANRSHGVIPDQRAQGIRRPHATPKQ
jgi:hypothetical protein